MGYSQRRSDPGNTSLCQAIVEAVAEHDGLGVTEVEPPEYTPLYDVVDPEAFEAVFAPTADGRRRTVGSVGFEYAGYHVTVHSDGNVELTTLPGFDGTGDDSTDR